MTRRAVYDTMIFFQWAALPKERQHATVRALYDGSIRLCLSQETIDEIKDVLSRPEVTAKAPHLTDDRIKDVLTAALEHADWLAHVPKEFTLTTHSDDDHVLNLAIAARADLLVTWETRLTAPPVSSTPHRVSDPFTPKPQYRRELRHHREQRPSVLRGESSPRDSLQRQHISQFFVFAFTIPAAPPNNRNCSRLKCYD